MDVDFCLLLICVVDEDDDVVVVDLYVFEGNVVQCDLVVFLVVDVEDQFFIIVVGGRGNQIESLLQRFIWLFIDDFEQVLVNDV